MVFEMRCSDFIPPPEAPVFEPTWEEFKNPMAYIEKIRPVGEKYGICKIRPPPSWAPPFAIDSDTFKFTPRIQKLNELEVLSRVKMNYIEQLTRFWKFQGIDLKIPLIERRVLDLFRLRKIVNEEGGLDVINENHKWPKIVQRLGYSGSKGTGSVLKSHYEKLILPYDEFLQSSVPKGCVACDDEDQSIGETHLEEVNEKVETLKHASADTKPSVKVQKGRRMGSEVLVTKKPMFHCYTSGTKLTITTSPVKAKDNMTPGKHKKETDVSFTSPADGYFCEVCEGGDDEEHMLLCDGCDDAYHLQCLNPPLTEVPAGDWICPKCLAEECRKPLDVYGFEQSEQEYTLETFGCMADKFKSEHFSASPQQVPYSVVEKEFWRLVSCLDEDVSVEYGADIHAGENGSGFPTEKTSDRFSGEEDYIVSGWNLNNLPVLGSSLLQFVSVDISGMKVPWIYVGMCFASFSWHTEDHWSYSINYLHKGEPKTWYGVPGAKADLLEGCMKKLAPELFAQSPDLLHQLTTIMNPNVLMTHGVPIYRTDQEAGNFVITFPRAYHAGFNQGYNTAEAVNFCPPDWIPMGRACIEHYRSLKRQCVFSHDELLCQIAENVEKVDVTLAQHVYDDLKFAVEQECRFREKLIQQGLVKTEKKIFELQEDDARQCALCNTTCFLSALRCSCRPDKLTCIDHSEKLCKCDASLCCLVYRYTPDELTALLTALKTRADQLEEWKKKARMALEPKTEKKKDVTWFKELISEVSSKYLPKTKELEALKEAVSAADVCIEISRQLLDRKVRSSQRTSDLRNVSRLTVAELENFCLKVDTLLCTFKEAVMFQDLLTSVDKFKKAAADILQSSAVPSVATLEFQIDWGTRLEVDLPELMNLNEMLQMAKWINDYEKIMTNNRYRTLAELRKLKMTGASLQPHSSFQSSLAKVMNLLAVCENLEQRAISCLAPGCCSSIGTLESIVAESDSLKVTLPHIQDIKSLLKSAEEWSHKVEEILSTNDRFLIPDEVESLRIQGEKIPVKLELLDVLKQKLVSINVFKDKFYQIFVDKSGRELLQTLAQEMDADENQINVGQEAEQEVSQSILPKNSVAKRLAKVRALKLEDLRKEQDSNYARLLQQANNCGACVSRDEDGLNHIQQCLECAGKYFGCRSKNLGFHGGCLKTYICPSCKQIKRVTIEDMQQLVSSYQQLGFLVTEGRLVAYMAAEVSRWQNMARLTLSTDEMTSALKLLNYPLNNPRIWGKECMGEKNDWRFKVAKQPSKPFDDVISMDWSEMSTLPIDLSLSSSRREALSVPTKEDLVQKIISDGGMQQQLMTMDLSQEAQASLNDLLLESRVLNVVTEEARIISFLLFAAYQRMLIVETKRKEEETRRKLIEEELRKKREEELRRKREEEMRKKREEEELQRKREEEIRKKREEELARKLQEELIRKEREAEELRIRKEEELRMKKEEEERKKKEELQKKYAEKEDLKRKREEEELRRQEDEEKKWKKNAEACRKKEAGAKKDHPTGLLKKDTLQRKKFQELQRVDEEHKNQAKLESEKETCTKSPIKTTWLEDCLTDSPLKNQENKKNDKNEENLAIQTGKCTKAKKRKAGMELFDESGKKAKNDKDGKTQCGAGIQKKQKGSPSKKKKGKKVTTSDDDEDDNDSGDGYGACAASKCLKPPDHKVNWVQCDNCDKWYHLVCQGLSPKQVSGSQPYFCPLCPQKPKEAEADNCSHSSNSVNKQGSSVASDDKKSKSMTGKNTSKEQTNNNNTQVSQNATPKKTANKNESPKAGKGQVPGKVTKKTSTKKQQCSAVNVQNEIPKALPTKSQSESDLLTSVDETHQKKAKKKEKPKTPSPGTASKHQSLLPGWSQKLTTFVGNDSGSTEGNTVTQKPYFSQYLYMPWLSSNSSVR